LESSLHPVAISESPEDETLGQPRISSVFSFVHFESAVSELSVISVQWDRLIASSIGQPCAI